MAECKHLNAVVRYLGCTCREAVMWRPWTNYAKLCADCGAWLSLGPSNDTPEVLVEIRAAEIAVEPILTTHEEGMGWLLQNAWDADCNIPRSEAEWAGWLARCIATHGEDS